MENFCTNLEIYEHSSIIGDKDQVLQVMLKKGDSIVCKKQSLYYMSSTQMEEVIYHKKNLLLGSQQRIDDIMKKEGGTHVKDNNLINLKNNKNSFEYLGLFNGGKIYH